MTSNKPEVERLEGIAGERQSQGPQDQPPPYEEVTATNKAATAAASLTTDNVNCHGCVG